MEHHMIGNRDAFPVPAHSRPFRSNAIAPSLPAPRVGGVLDFLQSSNVPGQFIGAFGRYLDYKQETQRLQHERERIRLEYKAYKVAASRGYKLAKARLEQEIRACTQAQRQSEEELRDLRASRKEVAKTQQLALRRMLEPGLPAAELAQMRALVECCEQLQRQSHGESQKYMERMAAGVP